MREDLTNATDVILLIDNKTIEAEIIEISQDSKILCEVKEGMVIPPIEIGKQTSVSFNISGQQYFVVGKILFQPPRRIVITTETELHTERREEIRLETPFLPATVTYQHKFFRHEKIKAVITNMSLKGARIETSGHLKEKAVYNLETYFPYHHQQLFFFSSFCIKNWRISRNIFSYGVLFINMDISSENNLKKYLFGDQMKFHFK